VQAIGAVRGTHPGSFAVVMATGIVSAALRDVNRPHASDALLVIAAAGFVVLTASSALRAAGLPLIHGVGAAAAWPAAAAWTLTFTAMIASLARMALRRLGTGRQDIS
jgi:hypothetical protein